ncbi:MULTISPECIES: hypothetical protein [Achromobacter]|uniref:Uncharacterized protein n=1 Tax=Achromobacter agilis TaxID=1353888 RepID=A0A446CL66_9BURK|nr:MULTISPECIES: hypothetical protein [Achromobacter]KGD95255.1 hypothetical protein JL37_11235 [Achromobacter sp. RTa]SSW68503.1 hypothetical protein AGI3411_03693 [Achromobacter agilis]
MTERNAPFPRLAVALAYAFSEERHTLNRPAVARAADMRLGEPGPLAGVDGCAEIAQVRQFLERGLEPLHLAVLWARYGQRKVCCKHCQSEGDHPGWVGALQRIAVALGAHLSMRTAHSALLHALVRRYYDRGSVRTLQAIADEYACNVRSVERASAKANEWLRGAREKKGAEPIYGIEQAAHAAAEMLLRGGGFIP